MSKRYKCVVQRVKEYPSFKDENGKVYEASTISWVKVFDTNENNKVLFVSCAVENIGPSSDVRGSDKRILPGVYLLKWRQPTSVTVPADFRESKGKRAPWLYRENEQNLPLEKRFESRYVLFHIGNSANNSGACVLLGNIDKCNGTIEESTLACDRFFKLLDKIGIENVEVEVKEINT